MLRLALYTYAAVVLYLFGSAAYELIYSFIDETFFPAHYWNDRVDKYAGEVSTYDFIIRDTRLEITKKEEVFPIEVAQNRLLYEGSDIEIIKDYEQTDRKAHFREVEKMEKDILAYVKERDKSISKLNEAKSELSKYKLLWCWFNDCAKATLVFVWFIFGVIGSLIYRRGWPKGFVLGILLGPVSFLPIYTMSGRRKIDVGIMTRPGDENRVVDADFD